VYVTGEQVYSCGMHNLGYPDAIIDAGASENPVELLRVFSYYLFSERPAVATGETFRASEHAPRYRLSLEPCELYDSDDIFHNPYGMWRLTQMG